MPSHTAIIRALYKKAMLEPVVLELRTPQAARTFRLTAYNAIRPVKTGKDLSDPELVEAVNSIEACMGEKPGQLIFRQRSLAIGAQAALKALGMDDEAVERAGMTPEARAELEKIEAELSDRLGG